MGPSLSVPRDLAAQVQELYSLGLSWERIAVRTGLPHSTCQQIVAGRRRTFSDDLTARQRMRLLGGMRPTA